MAGLEKILEDIRAQAEESAQGILNEANEKASAILEKAKAETEAECAQIRAAGEKAVADRKERAASAAALSVRQAILSRKQEIMKKAFDSALEKAASMPEGEYFSALMRLAAQAAHDQEGEIAFSEKDLSRLPGSFEKELNEKLTGKAALRVAKKPVRIPDGFTLRYGGIEENCSFEAMLNEKKEELQDEIRKILFPD